MERNELIERIRQGEPGEQFLLLVAKPPVFRTSAVDGLTTYDKLRDAQGLLDAFNRQEHVKLPPRHWKKGR